MKLQQLRYLAAIVENDLNITAAAERMGRPVPQPGHAYVSGPAWLAAEWHLLRLVAVCMIAESSGLL